MATKTVVCPECASPLTPGRFACTSCGALVAAVASTTRLHPVPDQAHKSTRSRVAAPTPAPAPQAPRIETPSHDRAADELLEDSGWMDETPEMTVEVADPAPAPAPAPAPGPAPEPAPPQWPSRPEPAVPAVQRGLFPTVLTPIPAGAYLPPSAILPPAESQPAPAWGPSASQDARPAGTERSWSLGASISAAFAGLPVEAPAGAIALGSAVAAFGFILPWADIVIGSLKVSRAYFDQWGLAAPGHVFVLGVLIAMWALALASDRLPGWARPGSLSSIGLASLLIGLVWPYLFGPFNASIGVYVVCAGAFAMAVGGLLDRVTSRHVEPSKTV